MSAPGPCLGPGRGSTDPLWRESSFRLTRLIHASVTNPFLFILDIGFQNPAELELSDFLLLPAMVSFLFCEIVVLHSTRLRSPWCLIIGRQS